VSLNLRPPLNIVFQQFGQSALVWPIGYPVTFATIIEKSVPKPTRTFEGIIVEDARPRVAIRSDEVPALPEGSLVDATLQGKTITWRVDRVEHLDSDGVMTVVLSPVPV
jgi:hypothetical protein